MQTASIALIASLIVCAFLRAIPTADAAAFKEKVLYSFCSNENCTDGAFPSAPLIDVKGTLYGTTGNGGAYNGGAGTVFAVRPNTGGETVIHSFCSKSPLCTDGASPHASLIYVRGTLYSTTAGGGAGNCEGGCGTVFSITPGSSGSR